MNPRKKRKNKQEGGETPMANYKTIYPGPLIEKFQFALKEEWGYIWGTAGEKWTAAKQAELEKTTDSDRELGRKYGKKWIGHKVADCSGLFSWAFKQLGGYMYHGSDTMFRKYCTANGELKKGKRTDGQELKPGTAVFTYNASKKKYGHVGLYIGNGLVIEAEGTIKGVITSKVSGKWTHWGELKGVDYTVSAPVPAPSEPAQEPAEDSELPTLRKGSKGPYVTKLQTILLQRGYDLGSYGADGDFGKMTEAAVKKFQADWGLTADGIVGKKTWEKLEHTPAGRLVTVHIPNLTQMQAEALIAKYAGSYMTTD